MQNVTLKIENNFASIEFDQPDSKVNVLSSQTLTELNEIILQLNRRRDIKGVLLLSGKTEIFIAGADIKEIEKITSKDEARTKVGTGQKIINALENLPIPSVALINGACLGGGLELALACDYRLATLSDKVKLGLPEVKLGIIPAFGGTKRLPRIVGLRKGIEMIVSGEPVSAKDASKIGLVDGLASQNRLFEEGLEFLEKNNQKRRIFKPSIKGLLNVFLDSSPLGQVILESRAKKFILKTTRGHYPAPLVALDTVVKNYRAPLLAALARETEIFSSLVIGEICKNLITVFYMVGRYKKEKWVDAKPHPIYKCAVLGGGVMGGGIAQIFSFYGLPVRMKDLNYEALGRGVKQAADVYDYAVKKKKITASQADSGMALISPVTTYSGFSNADLIVEAVVEDMKVKKDVFSEIDPVSKPDAILVSNTSCLSITQMCIGVKDKGRTAGMHFFNPVHRMPLIEIIRAADTRDETIAALVDFSKKIGKTPIVVKDACGFLINRILLPYLNEAGFLLDEGIDFIKIDRLCLEFGMPMGPFALMDEIGIDVGYKVALLLEENFGERMKAAEVLKKVHSKKWLGKKSKKGFYIHAGKRKLPNEGIYKLTGIRKQTLPDEEISNRMVYRMVNEAAMCLEEKICKEASDVDIGMIMGTGFPLFRGGLLRYADSVGLNKVAQGLVKFKEKTGSKRFEPCEYLLCLVKRKENFYSRQPQN